MNSNPRELLTYRTSLFQIQHVPKLNSSSFASKLATSSGIYYLDLLYHYSPHPTLCRVSNLGMIPDSSWTFISTSKQSPSPGDKTFGGDQESICSKSSSLLLPFLFHSPQFRSTPYRSHSLWSCYSSPCPSPIHLVTLQQECNWSFPTQV